MSVPILLCRCAQATSHWLLPPEIFLPLPALWTGEPDVIVLVSRLAHRQELAGGWGDAHIVLPPGRWRNVLEEGEVEGPQLFVRDACATLPVAVYARCEAEDWGGTGTENGAAEYPETGSEESDD